MHAVFSSPMDAWEKMNNRFLGPRHTCPMHHVWLLPCLAKARMVAHGFRQEKSDWGDQQVTSSKSAGHMLR